MNSFLIFELIDLFFFHFIDLRNLQIYLTGSLTAHVAVASRQDN